MPEQRSLTHPKRETMRTRESACYRFWQKDCRREDKNKEELAKSKDKGESRVQEKCNVLSMSFEEYHSVQCLCISVRQSILLKADKKARLHTFSRNGNWGRMNESVNERDISVRHHFHHHYPRHHPLSVGNEGKHGIQEIRQKKTLFKEKNIVFRRVGGSDQIRTETTAA